MQLPRRKRNRLAGYDYARPGVYFITISTKNFLPAFGRIEDGRMLLNEAGCIVKKQWLWLQERYDCVKLDAFVVMPDHIHGILILSPIGGKIKPLPELMGAFKTTSSKLIHMAGNPDFHWHKSYHDRIIRKNGEFDRIQRYIRNNPARWGR